MRRTTSCLAPSRRRTISPQTVHHRKTSLRSCSEKKKSWVFNRTPKRRHAGEEEEEEEGGGRSISVLCATAHFREYGYEQKGVLRIPCHAFFFERVLEAVRIGTEAADLLKSLADEL